MSALPRKLLYLALFLLLHFVVCRLEELLWLHRGGDWSRLVDPFSVRVRALKAILARRGIGIDSSLERRDLSGLVYGSGRLTEAEVAQAVLSTSEAEASSVGSGTEEDLAVTEFSGVAHFDELVEDCKDSAWLVEVRQHGVPAVPATIWRRLALRLRLFDIRLGRVDCQRRLSLCSRKGFHRSGLLLATPKGRHRMKDSVVYSWFTRTPQFERVLRWLAEALGMRVPRLEGGLAELQRVWNSSGPDAGDLVLALDSARAREVPLLLSALSVRFTGRVRFWQAGAEEGRALFGPPGRVPARPSSPETGPGAPRTSVRPATFLLVSGAGRRVYEYGARPDWSEATTFRALGLFLKLNYPEANDVFMALLHLVCALALLSLAIRPPGGGTGGATYRLLGCVWSFCVYVFLFFVLYPPLVHLLSHRAMAGCRAALLTACQAVARSALGGLLRRDCLSERYSLARVGCSFAIFLLLVALVENRRSNDEETTSEESGADGDTTRLQFPPPYDPEAARMDHMVNYLYSSLWLPPNDFEKDYVDHLTVWQCVREPSGFADQEAGADGESRRGEELGWPSGTVYTRQCSVCLGKLRRGVALCGLPCGHVFHEQCVKQWLRQPDKDSCPNCRWPAFKFK